MVGHGHVIVGFDGIVGGKREDVFSIVSIDNECFGVHGMYLFGVELDGGVALAVAIVDEEFGCELFVVVGD